MGEELGVVQDLTVSLRVGHLKRKARAFFLCKVFWTKSNVCNAKPSKVVSVLIGF